MTPEKAISILSKVKSVEEWNQTRDYIKSQVYPQDWLKLYFPIIDASGLIVTILGQD